MKFSLPCVIFAGGRSSRMGEDKSLLPFGNFKTLTQYQLHRLNQIFQNVYISTKESSKFDFEADFIEDVKTDISAPTVGFVSIFEKLECESFFALSVDTPFVDYEIIATILDSDTNILDATIATVDGKVQPLCGVYHNSLYDSFKKMLQQDTHKLGFLLKSKNVKLIEFDCKDKFLNMNHKSEYEKGLAILERC